MQYSIILTVHNKAFLIKDIIQGILSNTTGDYELILVYDGCTDISEEIVNSTIEGNGRVTFKKLRKLWTPNVFETRANNAGLKIASGKYSIIVQDDCLIQELGWNERLAKPCETYDDIWAVTGNTAHNWRLNQTSPYLLNPSKKIENNWCDILEHYDHANLKTVGKNVFAVRESVNRGPLLLRSDILKLAEYLDENNDKQDMDDHRLMFKVRKNWGLKCGYYGIDFQSDNNWGGTRENGQTKKWLLEANLYNTKEFVRENMDYLTYNKSWVNEHRILC